MKKLSICIVGILLAGCDKDPNMPSASEKNNQVSITKEEIKKQLMTEREKEFLKFSIEDELKILPTLSSGDNESLLLTDYFPIYSAEQITNDYDQNEIKANNLYKNKYFFVNGKVSRIEAGVDDSPIVRLKTKANYGFNSPMLQFNKVEYANVAKLSKGEKVTFFCAGNSEIAGSPLLDDCLFLETFKTGIVKQAQNFKDQKISGDDKLWERAIYVYVSSTLFLGQISNDFQKCKIEDIACLNKLAQGVSDEDKEKYKEMINNKLPEASESIGS